MLYTLKIKLVSTEGKRRETNRFEFDYDVRVLERTRGHRIVYDKELKRHFQGKAFLDLLCQIDIKDINLHLSGELDKASEFIRRTCYMNDWAVLNVEDGKVVSAENKEELVENWQKIKTMLMNDYKGGAVEAYLQKADDEVQSGKQVENIAMCYQHAALLFPGIPLVHGTKWKNSRQIKLSPHEDEVFEERTTYVETIGSIRTYSITGNTKPGSRLNLEKFEGRVLLPIDQASPDRVSAEVMYRYEGICNHWNFELTKSHYQV